AVGLKARARATVAQQLLTSGASVEPQSASERATLVREIARALRLVETEWTHFGYGERLDLTDGDSARRSFELAAEDFRKRSEASSASTIPAHAVVTLIVCTRREMLGVSALD